MAKVACVIPAAGWGSIRPNFPKVLEEIAGRPMIGHVIELAQQAGLKGTAVIVLGSNGYGERIRTKIRADGHRNVQFATQPGRFGAADAVARALGQLSDDEQHVLVTFADMPLWRAETLRRLVAAHLAEPDAVITMVTMRLQPGHRTERYGRIARDENGRILAAFEPWELLQQEPLAATFVNPSLYVFNRRWLAQSIPLIPPTDKGDGFPAELYLPKLLLVAHEQQAKIVEMVLNDPSEALGVNTAAEFDEVVKIWRERHPTHRGLFTAIPQLVLPWD